MTAISTHNTPHKGLSLALRNIWVYKIAATEYTDEGIVNATVGLMSFDVFIAILEGSYQQNNEKRDEDKARRYRGKLWEELKDIDEKEETLKEVLALTLTFNYGINGCNKTA
jgi:hypothetical protein